LSTPSRENSSHTQPSTPFTRSNKMTEIKTMDPETAARYFGVKKKTLRKWEARGMIESNGLRGDARLYYVSGAHVQPLLTVAEPSYKPQRFESAKGKYYSEVDESRRVVVAYIPFLAKPLRVDFEVDAQLHRAYSSDGENMTVKQMARKFGYSEKTLRGYLRARGLEHASLVWPEHEMAELSDAELLESAEAIRAAKITAKMDQKDVEELKRKAAIADSVESWLKEAGKAFNETLRVRVVPTEIPTWPDEHGQWFDWIVPETDTHIDCMGVEGRDFDHQLSLVREHRDRLIQRCSLSGNVNAWHKWVGSDLSDGDGKQGKTTSLRVQQFQTLPSSTRVRGIVQAEIEACETYLATGRPLYLYKVNGNHDWWSTDWLYELLRNRYADDDRVIFGEDVGVQTGGRVYTNIGNSLCIFAHGQVGRLNEQTLREMAMTEAPVLLAKTMTGLGKVHVLRGDKHTRRQIDSRGGAGQDVGVCAMSPQTEWANEMGFTYQPRLHAFAISQSGNMPFDITSEE